ncbi:MAG: ABC transporter ATP-binding protein/permease [Clostridiales bacterium]|nr:ABC transporter ATP-binding protein/permease [Clostridiales bacterium]
MAEQNKNGERPIVSMRPGGGPGGPRGGGPGGPMVREKPKNVKGTFRKLTKYIGKNKYLLFALVILVMLIALLNLAGPALQATAISTITIDHDGAHVDFAKLYKTVILMAAVYIVSSVFTYLQGIAAAKLSQNTVSTMRQDLFEKISYLPIKYTDTHRHGDIMSRMTNDVENISNSISQSIASLFSAVITLIGSLVMMIYYSWQLTIVAMVTIPLTLLVTTQLSKFMRKYFVAQQTILGQLNGHIEETVTGCKTVIAYSKEDAAIGTFAKIAEEYRKVGIKANIWGGIMGPCMNMIGNLGYLLVAAFGGYFAAGGLLGIDAIQAVLQYSKQFTRPINEIANQYTQILTAMAGAERVFEIMDADSETDNGKNPIKVEDIRGDITFRDMYFSYKPGEPVLKGFDLDVKQGQKIAIVGATGSGKTTVVNLLTRFYDIDSGEIDIDGININDIPKSTLRHAIAIVLQDTVLFSDTIASNIRYGRQGATDEEIKQAAHTANADTFIERLPEGYDTELSESGSDLSQGQRQLLAIARAVLADPKILILDEATSSVDTRTEMHIQSAMVALMKGRTSLIIAHRLSTIRDADKIVVLDGGVVAEAGSHEELLAKKGAYWKLYQNQYAGFAT